MAVQDRLATGRTVDADPVVAGCIGLADAEAQPLHVNKAASRPDEACHACGVLRLIVLGTQEHPERINVGELLGQPALNFTQDGRHDVSRKSVSDAL